MTVATCKCGFPVLASSIGSGLGRDIKLDRLQLFGRCYHSVLRARCLRTEIRWVIFSLPLNPPPPPPTWEEPLY